MSYWSMNNLSLVSPAGLLNSEQPVTCITCWAIDLWTTCHLHPLLGYWTLNNLSLAPPAKLLIYEKPVPCIPWFMSNLLLTSPAELLIYEQPVNWIPCWGIDLWTTCHLHPLLRYWTLTNQCWLISSAELMMYEQPAFTYIPCWAIELWTACHLDPLLSYWFYIQVEQTGWNVLKSYHVFSSSTRIMWKFAYLFHQILHMWENVSVERITSGSSHKRDTFVFTWAFSNVTRMWRLTWIRSICSAVIV